MALGLWPEWAGRPHDIARSVGAVFGPRARRVAFGDAHAYVEYRVVDVGKIEGFARAVEREARGLSQLRWLHVNADLGRVMFAFEPGAYAAEDLVHVVAAAEVCVGLEAPLSERAAAHPADLDEATRWLVELAADTASLGLAVALRVSPFPPMPLAGHCVTLLSLVRSVPRLRAELERRIGPERSEIALNLLSAAALSLAQRPYSALVEVLHKRARFEEARAQRGAWLRREAELCRAPMSLWSGVQSATLGQRPVPLPSGPIEEYADRAVLVSLGGFGLSFLTTRSFQRATAALFGGLPRPARLGREVFCAALAVALADRGVVVLRQRVLRRLDRIDCLVLHGDLISRRQFLLGAVRVEGDEDAVSAREQAQVLFDPKRPLDRATQGLWCLLPWAMSQATVTPELARHARERAAAGALVLSLERAGHVVAIAEVEAIAVTGVEELIAAAHAADMRVVIADSDDPALEQLSADEVLGPDEDLASGIRRLQAEGYAVCLVASAGGRELALSDCAVGLCRPDRPTPWSADLLARDDLADAVFIIRACAAARRVSRQSVQVAMAAASLGTVTSAGGLLPLTHRRVMFVVNTASLVAMTMAARSCTRLRRTGPVAPRDPVPWHALDPYGALARLSSRERGLGADEARRRQVPEGPKRRVPFVGLGDAITDELLSPLAPLLAGGAALSATVGSLSDGLVLAGVATLSAVTGGVQRYRAERRIRRLAAAPLRPARVRRDGVERIVTERDLVLGDVVVLGAEDIVPADCRIVESVALEVDASSLTGESLPVSKSAAPSIEAHVADRTSMLYAGTTIAAGRAVALVVATGDNTAAKQGFGAMVAMRPPGGVELRLRRLMELTGPIAAAACAGVVGGGLLRGRRLEDLVGSGVSLAVASVPEGLPLLATAGQLAAAERLARKKALVRNPRSVEALGRVDVICVDKTGTLTHGELELTELEFGDGPERLEDLDPNALVALAAGLRATAHGPISTNDPTDDSLRRAAQRLAVTADKDHIGWRPLCEVEFTPGRGFHATLATTAAGHWLSVKGAPEAVLQRCSAERAGRALTGRAREHWMRLAQAMGDRGLRVLAVAERACAATEGALADGDVVDLQIVALLGFSDPVRASARAAVAGVAAVGVETVMLTGDHPSTARAVAAELGLLGRRRVMTGAELQGLSDDALAEMVRHVAVFARVTPAQKVRVLRALQQKGRVVAMLGDGTNDAPALRLADCGIAVGERATSAARAAADVLLLDGKVETLVDAIVEGRAMWASVRDAVSILLGGNLGEIAFTLGVGLIDGRPPLSARQLLLVNLLTDVAPAMAIALRPPPPQTREELARLKPEQTLAAPLNREIALRALSTSLGAGTAWTVARLTGGSARARTIALAALVGSQLGQTVKFGGLSRPVLATSLGSAALLVGVIQTPGVSHFFGCRPLGPLGWTTAITASYLATQLSAAALVWADRLPRWWQRIGKAEGGAPSSSRDRLGPADARRALEPFGAP